LYHVRKAAGTTVREVLHTFAKRSRVGLFETEGVTLDNAFLAEKPLLSVITLWEPVSRVMSLYWYEHVGWYHTITKEDSKIKSLKVWVDAWRDGSTWKSTFMHKNPSSVYVEIENYYVKLLIGWRGPGAVDENDLLKAMKVLEKFDVILLTEWMQDESQISAFNSMFPGRSNIATGYKVRGDKKMVQSLSQKYASDAVSSTRRFCCE
jgi:hypothetical protein